MTVVGEVLNQVQ